MTLIQSIPSPASRQKDLFLKGSFFLLAVVYLADCFTPLRLHTDTMRYFALKDYWEFHYPADQFGADVYYSHAATDYFPYGYTTLLVILSKLGLLHSFTLVLINCLYLFGGLLLLRKVFPALNGYLLYVVVLINWLFIKFVAHPLSEMQFIFFSMASIYCYFRFTGGRQMKWVLLSFLLALAAFMTRTVGVSLVGAIAAALIWEYRREQMDFFRRHRIGVISLFTTVAILLYIFSDQLGLNHYRGVLTEHSRNASLSARILWHFQEWGEVFLNLPSNKVIDRFGQTGYWLFVGLGITAFLLFFYMILSKKSNIPLFIKLYLIFYTLIMFNWPFYDPRFWVPVMPVMAACLIEVMTRVKAVFWSRFVGVWLVLYLVLGSFAAGYMVFSSFNKPYFAKNQAKGVFRNEYETHFFGKPLSDTAHHEDPYVLHVLKAFD